MKYPAGLKTKLRLFKSFGGQTSKISNKINQVVLDDNFYFIILLLLFFFMHSINPIQIGLFLAPWDTYNNNVLIKTNI